VPVLVLRPTPKRWLCLSRVEFARLIDTATNKVKGVAAVGRSPHDAFFTPNG
jgi:hypothetical protein